MMPRKTHLDLFSGIGQGGFALAASWAGYTTVGFCEIDDYCTRVLRKHWPDVPVWGDVRSLDGRAVTDAASARREALDSERGESDSVRASGATDTCSLITAGYPCQPFSLAGKRLGAEDDRHLWPEVRRLLVELRPARFLGENVAGHINMGLDDVLSDLEEIGYAARPVVIPACAVNAPHRRDRVWIMAYAGCAERGTDDATGHHVNRHDPRRTQGDGRFGEHGRVASDGAGRGNGEPEAQQRMGQPDDGLPRLLADPRWRDDPLNAFGSGWEDGVPRVVATEKDRVHRLKALGNAIVPQVAYQVLLAMDAEAA